MRQVSHFFLPWQALWNEEHNNKMRNAAHGESVQVGIDSWFNCLTNWEIFYCAATEPPRRRASQLRGRRRQHYLLHLALWLNLMTWFARPTVMRCGWLASTGGHRQLHIHIQKQIQIQIRRLWTCSNVANILASVSSATMIRHICKQKKKKKIQP